MKNGRLYTIGLMLFGMVALGASPAKASTAAGSYYATPSWDQQLDASTRFIVLSNWGDAAVLDRETGLVWEQSPSILFLIPWEDAQIHCNQLRTGARLGWRLPTIQELSSLVDPNVAYPGPTLPAGNPFSNVIGTPLRGSYYWSATTYAGNTTEAWLVSFSNGVVSPFFNGIPNDVDKTWAFNVWCVRGGQGVDPQ